MPAAASPGSSLGWDVFGLFFEEEALEGSALGGVGQFDG
jgi:hypothetical protein